MHKCWLVIIMDSYHAYGIYKFTLMVYTFATYMFYIFNNTLLWVIVGHYIALQILHDGKLMHLHADNYWVLI